MIITELAVFKFDKSTRAMTLVEVAPGTGVEDIKAATGCDFKVCDNLKEFQI
jgi:3-oxoacid CoA-transferase